MNYIFLLHLVLGDFKFLSLFALFKVLLNFAHMSLESQLTTLSRVPSGRIMQEMWLFFSFFNFFLFWIGFLRPWVRPCKFASLCRINVTDQVVKLWFGLFLCIKFLPLLNPFQDYSQKNVSTRQQELKCFLFWCTFFCIIIDDMTLYIYFSTKNLYLKTMLL